MEFIEYHKCSTCIKARKLLDSLGINYIDRSIVDNTPTFEEISYWIKKYNLDIKKLFNTSGMKYRELGLKDKLDTMTDNDKIKLLASDGMLIKRPLLVCDDRIIIGFKEKEYIDINK